MGSVDNQECRRVGIFAITLFSKRALSKWQYFGDVGVFLTFFCVHIQIMTRKGGGGVML